MPRSNRRYSLDIVNYERQCTQCRTWLPETRDYFAYNAPRGLYNSWCKPCVAAYRRNVTTVGPRDTERSFGVEIEFHGSPSRLAQELRARGLEVWDSGYTHRVSRTAWKIVPDGSVSNGAELVSPILCGDRGFAALKLACDGLVASNATVDGQTGLHVHHDVRNLTVTAFRTMVTNWANSQTATDGLVSRSRRTNTYCAPFATWELESVLNQIGPDSSHTLPRNGFSITRYKAFNLQSYTKYGTVEVRQHQGTTDYRKIAAWVRFGQAMITAAVAGTTLAHTDTDALVDALPLDEATKSFLHERAAKFAAVTVRV